ncbi:hypothetical protein [Parafilimonas sp.]|uniref:hypothetical protein n=1 Tax=Parafilimonas sp. TaxID=1969739 RepID=UPI0039E5322A
MKKLSAVVLLMLGCVTCSKDTYNTKPTLEFKSVNATVFAQPSVVEFKLQCTDKEGDIVDTIWVQRVSKVANCASLSYTDSFLIPDFDPPKNVKVDFVFTYNYGSVTPPTLSACSLADDTSYFRFWMNDKANHTSDTVQSPDLVFLKQ